MRAYVTQLVLLYTTYVYTCGTLYLQYRKQADKYPEPTRLPIGSKPQRSQRTVLDNSVRGERAPTCQPVNMRYSDQKYKVPGTL